MWLARSVHCMRDANEVEVDACLSTRREGFHTGPIRASGMETTPDPHEISLLESVLFLECVWPRRSSYFWEALIRAGVTLTRMSTGRLWNGCVGAGVKILIPCSAVQEELRCKEVHPIIGPGCSREERFSPGSHTLGNADGGLAQTSDLLAGRNDDVFTAVF